MLTACNAGNNKTLNSDNAVSYSVVFDNGYVETEGIDIYAPGVRFIREQPIEDKINETLDYETFGWFDEHVLNLDDLKRNPPVVFSKTNRFLSIGLSYSHDEGTKRGGTIYNYIVVDMETGERIYLNDIIKDEDKFADLLKKGDIFVADREFFFEQDDADEAAKNYFKEMPKSDILDIIKNCNLSLADIKMTDVYDLERKPIFYIQDSDLVIEFNPAKFGAVVINLNDIQDILTDLGKSIIQ